MDRYKHVYRIDMDIDILWTSPIHCHLLKYLRKIQKKAEMPQRWDVPSEANVLDIECMKDLSKNHGPPSNRKIMI